MKLINMDNFRKQSDRRSINSVDGMVGGRSAQSRPQSAQPPRPVINGQGMKNRRGNLDNFRTTEGFSAAKQPRIQKTQQHQQAQERPLGRQPRRGPNGVIDLSLPPAPPSRFGRFKRTKKHRTRKQKFARGLAVVFAVLVLFGGFGYMKFSQVFRGGGGAAALEDNVDPTRLNGEGDGRVNILLLGKGGDGHEAPDLTDTILIASIDPVQKKAALLSIPRDMYEPSTSNQKINSLYAEEKYAARDDGKNENEAETAGLSAIQSKVSERMGIPIHYRIMVDFSGFEQAIDTVGGIDINVSEQNTVYEVLFDHAAGRQYVLDVKAGQQHFDGKRALFYSRSRMTSARGDFDRAERQRLVMIALKDKILSAGTFSNPVRVSQLIDNFGDHVRANLSIGEVMRIYEIGKSIPSNEIASISLVDAPNNFLTGANINGQSVQQPKAGPNDFSEIQNFVRNVLRDGYLTKEDATVAVYNGTATPGLAAKKADELKSYGYTVGTVANAPTSTYQQTIVVDLTNGQKKYTRNYLEKRFGVSAVDSIPDAAITAGDSDFVIIIGQDAVGN